MSAGSKNSADARFVHLLKRASFELRLAADIASFENFEPQVRALIAGARGNLRRALRLAEPATGQESGVRSQEPVNDERQAS